MLLCVLSVTVRFVKDVLAFQEKLMLSFIVIYRCLGGKILINHYC